METTKLFEMFKGTFQPALKEGKYKVVMTNYTYVPITESNQTDYFRFEFEVLDEGENKGRILSENRFEKGFGVMMSHIRQQLGRESEAIQPEKFLNSLIKDKTPLDIWIVKRIVNGTQKTNFNFLEPIEQEKPNTTIVEE